MGKNSRMRGQQRRKPAAYERPLRQAVALERGVRALCITSLVILALALFLPSWSVSLIAQNLANNAYKTEETAALSRVISFGQMSLFLLPVGALAATVALWLRKAAFSLIGLVLQVVGTVMLVIFAVTIGNVFAYNPLLHSGHGQGLTFWELFWRYYILLLPFIMQIAAVCMGFVASKKRDIAETMQNAADTSSTLTLDEESSTQNDT